MYDIRRPLAGISPKNIILKLIAYALSFWGAILGIMYSLKLDKIHKAARGDDPFGVQGCFNSAALSI